MWKVQKEGGRFLPVLVSAICFLGLSAQRTDAAERRVRESQMLVDFEEEDVLSRVHAGQGVSIALVDQNAAHGRRALEVKIAPFSVHRNQWPSVSLGPKYFTSPIDVSGYSRLEMTVRKLTPGFAPLNVTFSSLPYNDGGRNLEGELCPIPPEATTTARVQICALKHNDPSALQLMYITFPANEREEVYRIDAIRAVYDPTVGSPAEKLVSDAEALSRQFAAIQQKTDWQATSQNKPDAMEQEFSSLGRRIRALLNVCRQGARSGLHGEYQACEKELGELSTRLGRFLLAGKKGFVVWEIDPYVNILRDEAPTADSTLLERVEVQMAQGEFRDKVFMVSPCEKEIRIEAQIRGEGLPENAVQVSETIYLKDHLGQETGDAVYPLQGPVAIPAGESRQIRLRFDTRYGSWKPGRYAFRLAVRDRNSGAEKIIPGTAEVWPITLPSYDILPNNCYTEFDSSEFYEGEPLAKAVAHMKMYGPNRVYVHPVEMPVIKEVDAEGHVLRYDDAAFEKRVAPIVKAWNAAPGKETLGFIFVISSMYEPMPERGDLKFGQPRWKQVLAQWLGHLKETARKLGVADRQWMVVMGDEASESALANREIPMAETVKSIDPSIRTTSNTSTIVNDPQMSRRFFEAFDVLQPELTTYRGNPYLRDWLKRGGKPLWTYKCTGSLGARGKNAYEYYRVYGWELVKYGFSGTGLWTYCAQAQSQRGGGYILIHRRGDDVMHCRRYEMFREGLDDYRYVWALRELARQKGPQASARAEQLLQKAVDEITSHVDDTRQCEKWRMKIAEEILRLGS